MKILLCGYMGAGKSYLLENLPGDYALRIDLDREIERAYGPIDLIFTNQGEDFFRQLEKQTLEKLLQTNASPTLVALGGGTVTPELLAKRKDVGYGLLWLNTSFDTCYQRLLKSNRPKASMTKQSLWQLFLQREVLYRQADWCLTETQLGMIANDRDLFEKMTGIMKGQIDEALRHRS